MTDSDSKRRRHSNQEVFSETITSKDAPAQKIFHSTIFTAWFHEEVLNNGEGPRASALSAAKHRFASFAKPTGRILMHLPSFFKVLHRIAAVRSDASWARAWLQAITPSKLLLLALAADAADSLLELTRFLDTEKVDPAQLNEQIGAFIKSIQVQFLQGRVWTIEGYAKHTLQILASGNLYSFAGGVCKQLRLTDGLQQRVLLQFKPWVTLCEEACRAEFPHFDIFNSMLVFNLTGECLRETTQECQQCLRRLALALDVDPAALKHQWETLLPVATAKKNCGNLENREAWDQAFQQTQKKSYAQRQYKTDCLAPVLRAYACWSPSTHLGAIRGKGGRHFFKSVWHLLW